MLVTTCSITVGPVGDAVVAIIIRRVSSPLCQKLISAGKYILFSFHVYNASQIDEHESWIKLQLWKGIDNFGYLADSF